MRSSPVWFVALLGLLATACNHPSPLPVEPPPPVRTAPVPPPPPPITPAADSSELTLACDQSIDGLEQLPESYTPVADVVGLGGVGESAQPLQAVKQKDGLFFAKSGLLVKADASFELVVPQGSSLRLVWGNRRDPVARVRVSGCKGPHPWLAFAGGFWVDDPGRAVVVVRVGGHESRVAIAIAAATPGPGPAERQKKK